MIADDQRMTENGARGEGALLLPLVLVNVHLPLEDLLLPPHFNHMYMLARGE